MNHHPHALPAFLDCLYGCRRTLVVSAAAAPSTTAPPPPPSPSEPGPVAHSEERGHRLESMIQLRKLYRNLLRAEGLLEHPTPVYEAPPEPGTTKKVVAGAGSAVAAAASAAAPAAAAASSNGSGSSSEEEEQQQEQVATGAVTAAEAEAQRRLEEAVEVVAEMELTAEQLKAGLRALRACPYDFPRLFKKEVQGEAAAQLEARVAALFNELVARAAQEIVSLPFASESQAHAAIDARNARYRLSIPWAPAGGSEGAGGEEEQQQGSSGAALGPASAAGLGERLSKAEKAAEYFVALRLQPAVQRVKQTSPEGVVEGLKTSEWGCEGAGKGRVRVCRSAFPSGTLALVLLGMGRRGAILNMSSMEEH